MNIDAQKRIETIIQVLYPQANDLDEYNDRNELCLTQLVGLEHDYDAALASYAKRILSELREKEQNEFLLTMLLLSLQKRGQYEDLIEIASAALKDNFSEDKLFYVERLIECKDNRIPLILTKALYDLKSYDEYGGYAQEKIIEFLHGRRDVDANQAIIHSLNDISARVRASALHYIKDLDVESASNDLVLLLDWEDWEYNILIILELIKKWNKKEHLKKLQSLCSEEWVEENEEIRNSFLNTINHLSQK